jgi:hypothetical protein
MRRATESVLLGISFASSAWQIMGYRTRLQRRFGMMSPGSLGSAQFAPGVSASMKHGQNANKAAAPNRRPLFPFRVGWQDRSASCAQALLPAAVGEP